MKKQTIQIEKITETWTGEGMGPLDIDKFCEELKAMNNREDIMGFSNIEWHAGEFPKISYHRKVKDATKN